MSESVVLRPALTTDIPTLTRLDAELFEHEAWSEVTWWDEFAARDRRQYVVAANRGEILGYAGLDAAGSTADIMTIAVVPAARRTGLGQRLLDYLIDAAEATRAEALLLEVRADNDAAIRLYERNGFDRISVRRRYYQPGDIDAVIMRKLLEKS